MSEKELDKWQTISSEEISALPESELASIPENYPLMIINPSEKEAEEILTHGNAILRDRLGKMPEPGEAIWVSIPGGKNALCKVDAINTRVAGEPDIHVHVVDQETK